MKNLYAHLDLCIILVTLFTFSANAQWVQTALTNSFVPALAVSGSNVFASSISIDGTSWTSGIFLSTNNGASWTSVSSGLPSGVDMGSVVDDIAINDTNLFAATIGNGVFRSTNNANDWIAVNSGITNDTVEALLVNGTNVLAGSYGGIFRSTNNGTSWTTVNNSPKFVVCFAMSGSTILAGAFYDGVYLSADNGASWNLVNNSPHYVDCIATKDSSIFAGINSDSSIYRSTDGGGNWIALTLDPPGYHATWSFAVSGDDIFASVDTGVFLSTNNGASWIGVSSGLPDTEYIRSLAISNDYLFAGAYGSGVWRRPLSEMVGVINQESRRGITKQLEVTIHSPGHSVDGISIELTLPHSDEVAITIYNISGHELRPPIREQFGPGSNKYLWDTRNLAVGSYIARIQTSTNVYVQNIAVTR